MLGQRKHYQTFVTDTLDHIVKNFGLKWYWMEMMKDIDRSVYAIYITHNQETIVSLSLSFDSKNIIVKGIGTYLQQRRRVIVPVRNGIDLTEFTEFITAKICSTDHLLDGEGVQ